MNDDLQIRSSAVVRACAIRRLGRQRPGRPARRLRRAFTPCSRSFVPLLGSGVDGRHQLVSPVRVLHQMQLATEEATEEASYGHLTDGGTSTPAACDAR